MVSKEVHIPTAALFETEPLELVGDQPSIDKIVEEMRKRRDQYNAAEAKKAEKKGKKSKLDEPVDPVEENENGIED